MHLQKNLSHMRYYVLDQMFHMFWRGKKVSKKTMWEIFDNGQRTLLDAWEALNKCSCGEIELRVQRFTSINSQCRKIID